MNTTTRNDGDFYAFLMNPSAMRNFSLVFCMISIFVQPFLFYSLIWFDKYSSDHKRTFINMINTLLCWLMIEISTLIQTTEVLRLFIGPLPSFFCFMKTTIRSCHATQGFLYLDAISIIKYIFIFWLKNPAAFQDEFWQIFINVWIKGFSFIFNFIWFFTAEHQIINYYICTGKDPTEDFKKPLNIYNIIEISSILLQIVISLRIKIYKFSTMNKQERSNFKSSFLFDVSKQSLATLSTNFLNVLAIVLALRIPAKLSQMKADEMVQHPDLILFTYLVLPALLGYFVTSVFYIRHKKLRTSVWDELVEIVHF